MVDVKPTLVYGDRIVGFDRSGRGPFFGQVHVAPGDDGKFIWNATHYVTAWLDDEGVTWNRGHEDEARDALLAARALSTTEPSSPPNEGPMTHGDPVTVWRLDDPRPRYATVMGQIFDVQLLHYEWSDAHGAGFASCRLDTRGTVWAPGWAGDEVGALLARRALVA